MPKRRNDWGRSSQKRKGNTLGAEMSASAMQLQKTNAGFNKEVIMNSMFLILLLLSVPFAFAENGKMIQLQSGDEKIAAYYVKPSVGGPFPGMIVIQEWWGLNDQIKGVADRLAGEGYAALAVDLYRGRVTANPEEAHQYASGLPEDRAMWDLKSSFAYLQGETDITKNRIGSIGWCMGGGYSLRLAIEEPQLAACVVYYGRLATDPESLKKIQAPVLGIFGERDQAIPPDAVKKFETQMKSLEKDVRTHIYPGAAHGFFNETGKAYNKSAAEDAWGRTTRFLAEFLKK